MIECGGELCTAQGRWAHFLESQAAIDREQLTFFEERRTHSDEELWTDPTGIGGDRPHVPHR